MKYEPIFGDQSLFDGAPEDADAVFKSPMRDSRCAYYRLSHGHERYIYTDWVGVPAVDSQTFNAMRRIIPEPKRWTVEDQRAGRLPDVGYEYIGRDVLLTCVFVDKNRDVWGKSKDNLMYCHDYSEIKPIETPEEKAQRLRDDWCAKAVGVCGLGVLGMTTLTRIYDALLSGDLPVPGKEQL